MGLFTQDIQTMNELFIHQLQDIWSPKLTSLAEGKVNLWAAS